MTPYSIGPTTRKNEILSFARNLSNKYGKQLLDTVSKTGIDALKAASKKLTY